MGKAPAFQFYVRDWLSDPQLRAASWETQGIWTTMLCYMWGAPERGKLEGTIQQLARVIGSTNGELTTFLEEGLQLKFANVTCNGDVTNCNTQVTIINRRMFREEKDRKNTRLRVQRHREKRQGNKKVTPPSSSSPSSSTSKKKNIYLSDAKEIYEDYPRKADKEASLKSICKLLKAGVPKEELIQVRDNYIRQIEQNETEGEYIIQSNNFFGQKQRWREFVNPEKEEEGQEQREPVMIEGPDGKPVTYEEYLKGRGGRDD